jgi:phosphatidyl-myo-inositol dimannoside synthase
MEYARGGGYSGLVQDECGQRFTAMKILLIANTFPPLIGGSATVYEAYCRSLKERVAVVAPWRSYTTGEPIPAWQETDARQPFRVLRLELLRPRLRPAPVPGFGWLWRQVIEDVPLRMRIRQEVTRFVEDFRPDIVCLGEVYALSWLGTMLHAKGIATLQFIHGEEITTICQSRQLRKEAGKAFRTAGAIIAVSSFTRQRLIDLGLNQAAIHLITNGVNTDRFTPGPKSETVLDRHGLHGKKVLLTVARLDEKKGHDNVIRALPRILLAVPDAVYVIVGEGCSRARLDSLVDELKLRGNVIFTGKLGDDELRDYYRTCDLFIMPNRTLPNGDTEGFGLVFLEAAACGKPVIAGRAGGAPDAVIDQETGILVDGTSVEEISEAAIRLLQDREYADRLAAAGLRRSKQFDWPSRAQEFLAVCSSVVNRVRQHQST